MRFEKLRAEQLFDGYRLHKNKVLVLTQAGVVEAIIDAEDAGDGVKQLVGILSPGFVNCHCHLELSHLQRQIPENTELVHFVSQVVKKRNEKEEDQIREAIIRAEDEMLQNGIVAVGDICNAADTLFQKQQGRMYYQNFIEAIGSNPDVADKNFALYKKVFEMFANTIPAQQVAIAPHAPYSVSAPLWKHIMAHSQQRLFAMHNQETEDETLWFMNKTGGFAAMFKAMGVSTDHFTATGTSSLRAVLPFFTKKDQVLLVHNVYATSEDVEVAEAYNQHLYWCLCPNANWYIGRVLPDASLFFQKNCKIVLGTDSLASNHQLSIYEEIQTLRHAFPQIPLEAMLRWATSNGAAALKIQDRCGSFEKGKKPGVVHIVNDTATLFR